MMTPAPSQPAGAPALSVVFPCYNEADNLPGLFARARQAFAGTPGIETVFVDNGSTDRSAEVFARLLHGEPPPGARVVRVPVNRGYGYGIMAGLREARGDILAWTHADMQTDPADVLPGFARLAAIAPATPALLKGRRVDRPLFDALFTASMTGIASILLGMRLADINAQPKVFNRAFFQLMRQPPDDFALDLYALCVARRHAVPILEHPVSFAARRHGKAKGGGSLRGKLKLTQRTFRYIIALRRALRQEGRP